MAASATEVRNQVRTAVEDEFAPEGIVVRDDKLSDALGTDGAVAAVYPERQAPSPDNRIAHNVEVRLQMFRQWEKKVDPAQTVDPAPIETWAERIEQALERLNGTAGTGKVWYLSLEGIEYPDDPTGNKTRLVASIVGWGNNQSLVETAG